jgi:hypothetical protein
MTRRKKLPEYEEKRVDLNYLTGARAGKAGQVAYWLDAGAELYMDNVLNGWSAMHYALAANHPAVVRTLVAYGYDPNLHANNEHSRPLLCFGLLMKKVEAVDEFVRCGADINLKNKGNKPPLVFCLEENDTFGISYLLEAGADPEPALGYLNRKTDIKWFGHRPTKETERHFYDALEAKRRREGIACGDAMEQGSKAAVAPLKPLHFRLNRKTGFRAERAGIRL